MTRVRSSERGSAMLVTLIIVSSLLAGAAVLVAVQLASNNAADTTRRGAAALHCAEAGLAAARPQVVLAANVPLWNAALAAGTQPTWLNAAAIDHNIDDDSNVDDFTITLVDNDDEAPPGNNPAADNDLRIFIVSRCTDPRFAETPKEVRELVSYSGSGKCYDAQKGGCGKNGNAGTQ